MKTAPSTSQAHKTRWPVHCWHKGMSRIERPCPHHEPKKDSSLRQTTQTLMWEPQLQLFASGKLCWKENQPSLSRPILKVKELVAQWCPPLCNPMDLLSMEFSR